MRRSLGGLAISAAVVTLAGAVEGRSLQLVLEAVDLRGSREGFAIRSFDGIVRSIARTRDGGRTFEDVAALDRLALRGARAIASPDGRTVIATGDGWVLRSTNGARSFARVDVPADLSYRKVGFAGATATGWLLGVRSDEDPAGALFLTLDAGRTFRARIAPRDASVRDFAFLDPARGFAVEARGIVRTRDGGASFEVVPGAPAGRYTAVAASARTVLAAAESRLASSTDGGGLWQSRPLPTDAAVVAITILDARRWVIAAEGGMAWRTGDEGRNWTQLAPTPGHAAPRFLDDERAYAGGSAVLYLSGDAGDTWQPADPSHREDVATEEGEPSARVALGTGERAPPDASAGEEPAEGRTGRRGGAGAPAGVVERGHGRTEPAIEGADEAETEALRDLEGHGVPQSALRRAQQAAERLQKRGGRGGRRRGGRGAADWIEGARRSQRR